MQKVTSKSALILINQPSKEHLQCSLSNPSQKKFAIFAKRKVSLLLNFITVESAERQFAVNANRSAQNVIKYCANWTAVTITQLNRQYVFHADQLITFWTSQIFIFCLFIFPLFPHINLCFPYKIYEKLMEKKISEISEAFERLRFGQALANIEQTLKKNAKQDKKKQLGIVELKLMDTFRVGCLVSLGKIHQAYPIFREVIKPQSISIMQKENPFLLLSIAELFGENMQKQVIELMEKNTPSLELGAVQRFYLGTNSFSNLAKIFLKQFLSNKNNLYQLGQVYLEYLQNVLKVGKLEYQRDGWYKYNPDCKQSFKLVNMFLEKCLKTAEDSRSRVQNELKQGKILDQDKLSKQLANNNKVIQKGNELKLKIAVTQGRISDAIKLYHLVRKQLKFPFTFIRSILKLQYISQDKGQTHQFYVKQMGNIFKTNLNFSTYTPFYDYYQQFYQYLKEQTNKQTCQIRLNQKPLSFQQLYNFSNLDSINILNVYYNSLWSEYNYLTNTQNAQYSTNTKADYYKICLKGLLLQIIQISHDLGQVQVTNKHLQQYTKLFSPTLTYAPEIKKYWKSIITEAIIQRPISITNDGQLMQQINFIRISLALKGNNIADRQILEQVYKELIGLYRQRVKQVQNNRKLQKGERYISDEFVIILSDYIRAYLQHEPQQNERQRIVCRIVNDLQFCVEMAPCNADLKLRLMHFLSILNHHERLIEVYLTNDIKSVQSETLGYWFIRPTIQFGLEGNEQFLDRVIRSYHENQRQTSQYSLKALRAGQLDRLQEFLSYRINILSSYNSIILLFMFYQKYRFQNNSQYYLERILARLDKYTNNGAKLSFNADYKVMKNVLFDQYSFGQFYGLYNSHKVLKAEVSVYLHEQLLTDKLLQRKSQIKLDQLQNLQKITDNIDLLKVDDIYDFTSYRFEEGNLMFNQKSAQNCWKKTDSQLVIFKQLMKIRLSNIKLSELLIQSIQTSIVPLEQLEDIEKELKLLVCQLQQQYNNLHYRQQIYTISTIRRNAFESNNIICVIRQFVTKNKKLKSIKATIQASVSRCSELFTTIILGLKWRQTQKTGLVGKRDELLQRQLQIDPKQFKRILSKYQNINKI